MEHPHQGHGQPGAPFRLAAQALPEAAAADRHPVGDTGFGVREGRRPQGLDRDLERAALDADLAKHWAIYREGCEAAGRPANGSDWRVCRTILVAATDEEARAHVYGAESGYRHFYGHMHKVYSQIGRLGVLKSRPDMRDDEVTVDTFIEQRTIYGSPKTVLSELIALRRDAGPFGTLLLSGIDWAGPNAAWERESLTRLAQEVMPALSRADRRGVSAASRPSAAVAGRAGSIPSILLAFTSVCRKDHDRSQFAGRIAGRVARAVIPAAADPVTDFYRGKTLTMLVATSPGGDYDLRARLLARHISRHIPGEPPVIARNMPGAVGLQAANWLATQAPRDGTVLHAIMQNMSAHQALGGGKVEFDTRKFFWIGNTTDSPNVVNSWHTTGIRPSRTSWSASSSSARPAPRPARSTTPRR